MPTGSTPSARSASPVLMLGGAMRRMPYDTDEPFPEERASDDTANVLDHFYLKLLRIADMMAKARGGKRHKNAPPSCATTSISSGGRYI